MNALADEFAFWPSPIPTPHGSTHVAKALGLTRPAAENIILSGLADSLTGQSCTFVNHLDRPVLTAAGLDALAAVPWIDSDHGPAINPRVRPARRVDDTDRNYMGWHPRLTEQEANLATSRWWPIPRVTVDGLPLVVTVAGFVVRCGRIQSVQTDRGLAAYDVDWTDDAVKHTWARRRIHTPRGGIVGYIGLEQHEK